MAGEDARYIFIRKEIMKPGSPVLGQSIFHVLHVVSRLPVGGVENMLLKVVNGYDKKRFRASVCCIQSGGEIADELRRQGYRVEVLNRMQGHGFDIGAIRALCEFIKKEKIHILRTHQYHANLYGRIAGILTGVPVIIPSYHSRYVSPNRPKLHRRLINLMLSLFSDALVAVSGAVASDILSFDRVSKDKVRVIHNGIMLDDYLQETDRQAMRKKFSLPSESLLIGSVGRLKPEKGHSLLLQAVSMARHKMAVAIAGDGPLRHNLEDQAKRQGLNVFLPGMLPPSEVPNFLKALDIFCFPSLWEGMPSALIEAMAAGLPVISSDIPAAREILGDCGVLVPVNDVAALSAAIDEVADGAGLRDELIKKGRKRCLSFSLGLTVEKYQMLFDELLMKKGLL